MSRALYREIHQPRDPPRPGAALSLPPDPPGSAFCGLEFARFPRRRREKTPRMRGRIEASIAELRCSRRNRGFRACMRARCARFGCVWLEGWAGGELENSRAVSRLRIYVVWEAYSIVLKGKCMQISERYLKKQLLDCFTKVPTRLSRGFARIFFSGGRVLQRCCLTGVRRERCGKL